MLPCGSDDDDDDDDDGNDDADDEFSSVVGALFVAGVVVLAGVCEGQGESDTVPPEAQLTSPLVLREEGEAREEREEWEDEQRECEEKEPQE